MKTLTLLLACSLLAGCTSPVYFICGDKNAPIIFTDKDIPVALQGNVPVQGGTVSNPSQAVSEPK